MHTSDNKQDDMQNDFHLEQIPGSFHNHKSHKKSILMACGSSCCFQVVVILGCIAGGAVTGGIFGGITAKKMLAKKRVILGKAFTYLSLITFFAIVGIVLFCLVGSWWINKYAPEL